MRIYKKVHRVAALVSAVPLLFMIATGCLLQVKNVARWIQPEAVDGKTPAALTITFDRLLEVARSVPEAEVRSWQDVVAVDARPSKGVVRLRTKSNYEIQVDGNSGELLHGGVRRTGILIALHEGSWFGPTVKYGVFLPTALLLLALWITGIAIYALTWKRRPAKSFAPKTESLSWRPT